MKLQICFPVSVRAPSGVCGRGGINGWVNNREAGDLRRYRAHYDVIVMTVRHITPNLIKLFSFTYVSSVSWHELEQYEFMLVHQKKFSYLDHNNWKPAHIFLAVVAPSDNLWAETLPVGGFALAKRGHFSIVTTDEIRQIYMISSYKRFFRVLWYVLFYLDFNKPRPGQNDPHFVDDSFNWCWHRNKDSSVAKFP